MHLVQLGPGTCLHPSILVCMHVHVFCCVHRDGQVPAAAKKKKGVHVVDFALVRRSELLQLEERIGGRSMDICDIQDVSNGNRMVCKLTLTYTIRVLSRMYVKKFGGEVVVLKCVCLQGGPGIMPPKENFGF